MTIISPKDIAYRLGISERQATRLLKRGEIAGFRCGVKPWRTTELHLESYVSRQLHAQRMATPAFSPDAPASPVSGDGANDRYGCKQPKPAPNIPGGQTSPLRGDGLPITNRALPPEATLLGSGRRRGNS